MSYPRTVDSSSTTGWRSIAAQGARFAYHSRETFDAVLHTCERIARESTRRSTGSPTPRSRGSTATKGAPALSRATTRRSVYFGSGMLAAAQDYEIGGSCMPPIS